MNRTARQRQPKHQPIKLLNPHMYKQRFNEAADPGLWFSLQIEGPAGGAYEEWFLGSFAVLGLSWSKNSPNTIMDVCMTDE